MPRKGNTNDRGYNYRHKALRARWTPLVRTGTVRCARCGKPIRPDEPWDLGHIDGTINTPNPQWSGPEHRRCNRATAGRRRVPPRQPLTPPTVRDFFNPIPTTDRPDPKPQVTGPTSGNRP